jgi:LPS-assembly lipoprotein
MKDESKRITFLFYLCSLLCLLILEGCGFHLRGSRGEFRSIPPVYVQGQDPAVIELRQFLRVSGAPVVGDATAAQLVVTVLDARRDRRVLSVGSQGRVQEYELRYDLPFYIDDNAGHRLLEQQSVTQTRSYSFDETDVNAKSNEEDYLFRDMQRNAVMQIVRRLPAVSAKLHEAAPAPAEPAAPPAAPPSGPPGESRPPDIGAPTE